MTSFERARRNHEVVNARLRGIGERRVAEMCGVSERHVRRVLQEYRASRPALHDLDPAVALTDALDAYQILLEEAITLADEAKHESVRLGALKLRLTLLDARLALSPGIGLVPSEIERARMAAEWSEIARQIVDLLNRHGLSEQLQREIIDAIEGRPRPKLEPAVEADAETLTAELGASAEPTARHAA